MINKLYLSLKQKSEGLAETFKDFLKECADNETLFMTEKDFKKEEKPKYKDNKKVEELDKILDMLEELDRLLKSKKD